MKTNMPPKATNARSDCLVGEINGSSISGLTLSLSLSLFLRLETPKKSVVAFALIYTYTLYKTWFDCGKTKISDVPSLARTIEILAETLMICLPHRDIWLRFIIKDWKMADSAVECRRSRCSYNLWKMSILQNINFVHFEKLIFNHIW